MDYAMKVYPMHLENGKTEWCVEYPDLKGCVGGGDTIEEAITDAEAYLCPGIREEYYRRSA